MTRKVIFPTFLLFLAACGDAKEGTTSSSGTDSASSGDGSSGGSGGTTGMTGGGTTTGGDGTAGTGTSTSGGTTGGTSTSGGSMGFVQMPDSGGGAECNPKTQDCPDGEKCTAWADDGGNSWNANKCVPVTGNGQAGDPCTVEGSGVSGIDDCDVGHICWDVDPMTAMGVCVAFCDEADQCPAGTMCSIQNDGTLPLCSTFCNPLIQDCPDGQGCYAKDGAGGELICIPDASGNTGADGDPCEYDNVCDPGLVCIGGSAGCQAMWCCTPWCDVTQPNNCPGNGEECVPHFDMPVPGYEDLGVCILPP